MRPALRLLVALASLPSVTGSSCTRESTEIGAESGARAAVKASEQRANEPAVASDPRPTAVEPVVWKEGPHHPAELRENPRPRVVLLSAPWCQWCRVFEHEVLPDPEVTRALSPYATLHVDVDESPEWMDIPGFVGLPTLAFFDADGRHVLTRSGYRPASEVSLLLDVVRNKLAAGELAPYPLPPPARVLTEREITPIEANAQLEKIENFLFLQVNSNDGGFHTPARHPYPAILVELDRWRDAGGPKDIEAWIELTMKGALRGASPRLSGDPLMDMSFGSEELQQISRLGPKAGPRWREGIDRLPDMDPYRGLQDPVDAGVFRYSAGPGWYHPHFERRAKDNLAWAELLRRRGRVKDAKRILTFVEQTFAFDGAIATSQRSDPFYYRLRADERTELEAPPVAPLFNLDVQARAARADRKWCAALERVPVDRWPRSSWTGDTENPAAADAPPDAVGELLFALAHCGRKYEMRARALVDVVVKRWATEGLAANARLHPLAAGVCAARPSMCARALATVQDVEPSLDHPPPLTELAKIARASPH